MTQDHPSGDSALVQFPDGYRGRADATGVEEHAYYDPLVNLNFNIPWVGGWRYQAED